MAGRFAIGAAMDAGNRTVFISSCTRRQMARRKPTRTLRTQLLVAAIVLAVALGTFVAAGGGL